MATRVVLHVGTPKTGTTYLQTLMWKQRDRLRADGLLVAGDRRADHLYGSLVVRGASLTSRPAQAGSAWQRLCDQAAAFDGTVLISHEFYGAATTAQATRAIEDLAPTEVHVVVTARDCLRSIPTMWQEHVKFRSTEPLTDFGAQEESNPLQVWGWRTMDAADVLERWASALPPEQVHVVTMPPPGSPPDLLWRRFASVLGVDADDYDATVGRANDSLGVVEAELLRRVNTRLDPVFTTPRETGRWLRGYLAMSVLVPRGGERFGVGPEQERLLRRRSERIVARLRTAGYDVVGDLQDLLPPPEAPSLPAPHAVRDADLVAAAADTIAAMLVDVRSARLEAEELRARVKQLQRETHRTAEHDRATDQAEGVVGRVRRRLRSGTGR